MQMFRQPSPGSELLRQQLHFSRCPSCEIQELQTVSCRASSKCQRTLVQDLVACEPESKAESPYDRQE